MTVGRYLNWLTAPGSRDLLSSLYEATAYLAAHPSRAGEPHSSPELEVRTGDILDNSDTSKPASVLVDFEVYQQLHDIIEFLPDAIFVLDKEKRVIFWNRAIEEMTGVKKEEILGKGNHAYSIPFYGRRRPILIDFLDKEEKVVDRYIFIKRVGKTLFAESLAPFPHLKEGKRFLWGTATPLYDRYGNRIGGIESIRDVTEHRQFEEEKSKLEAQLHHSGMMERFVRQLGHDLKNPLTPLSVLLPLVRKQINNPELEKVLDICMASVQDIQDLTKKALKLASLSASEAQAHRETVNLHQAVAGCVGDFARQLSEKHLSVENQIDPRLAVQAAPDQLRELFSNLLSNAIRYSPQDEIITISARKRRRCVAVSVRDHGIGIAPECIAHIFEEFYKSDESRHDLKTSGLGLAICKKIISNHHGTIWAESPEGTGTAIHFTLPKAGVSAASPLSPEDDYESSDHQL